MTDVPFHRVAIVGLGLIGGSVAKALRATDFSGTIRGVVADKEEARRIRRAAGKWQITLSHVLAPALQDADLVILATPPQMLMAQLPEVARLVSPTAVVSDVGSIKVPVAQLGAELLGDRFVAAHPLVGGEKTGFSAARKRLYQGARVVLTPSPGQAGGSLEVMRTFWQMLGATIVQMTPEAHDYALAATSHVPHLLAFAYMAGLEGQAAALQQLAGGGLRDFSRIAASDPRLWADILWENRAAVRQHLSTVQRTLGAAERMLAGNDAQALNDLLGRGQSCRRQFQFPPVHS
ncbi:prephenate dehydrogenase/arogenate dehydrogenase family protein [Acidithiobacillus sp.]|jgi:prephenate dehydrogenase|uniref:prephenate dehydrogenase n=1 Tax=Acidithiobacillus sp. TaxID=1872118 RepID=UPI0025BC1DDA|nr:prephenate dehydrogenase/arogenate dehydrogenase family protein [Acidithiobacillus sp.]MCK9187528.1 prephenate dehydrogenase/arogenate dehydrogenase family protein [Acidithiobacillus sp.]MCK9358418.1 prephenate dehydrogenase/arogenate dehydrogenase family protein [Acidithiobacillus sp.]